MKYKYFFIQRRANITLGRRSRSMKLSLFQLILIEL